MESIGNENKKTTFNSLRWNRLLPRPPAASIAIIATSLLSLSVLFLLFVAGRSFARGSVGERGAGEWSNFNQCKKCDLLYFVVFYGWLIYWGVTNKIYTDFEWNTNIDVPPCSISHVDFPKCPTTLYDKDNNHKER
jgi:hypothetical protein